MLYFHHMELTEHNIEKLAELARIELTDEEKKRFGDQLTSILDYVKQIQDVDTTSVKEAHHTMASKNTLRPDEVRQYSDVQKIVQQFPEKHGHFNKVKPVLE